MQATPAEPTPQAGAGVGNVVDPTQNVRELVLAESKYQDGMREAEAKFQNGMRDAENHRLDDLAKLKARYDKQISDMLSVQVKTTSDLISTQLDKVTTALSAQITTLTATMNDRIAQLERFRYEMGGRTSVSDPATAQALIEMAGAIKLLRTTDDKSEGRGLGRSEIYAIIIVAIAAAGLFLGFHK
jgi:hypothetical protein